MEIIEPFFNKCFLLRSSLLKLLSKPWEESFYLLYLLLSNHTWWWGLWLFYDSMMWGTLLGHLGSHLFLQDSFLSRLIDCSLPEWPRLPRLWRLLEVILIELLFRVLLFSLSLQFLPFLFLFLLLLRQILLMNFIPPLSGSPLVLLFLLLPPDQILLNLHLKLFPILDFLIFHLLPLGNLFHVLYDFELGLEFLLLFFFLEGFLLGLFSFDLLWQS